MANADRRNRHMSARIIVLAEHRARRRHAAPRPASAIVAVDADDGSATDPYGLVAAVRALAANMEQMKGRSAKMQETYPSLPEEARTIVVEKNAVAAAVDQLSVVSALLARL